MRPSSATASDREPPLLDKARILRWVYTGRLAVTAGIFVAAVAVWRSAPETATLQATIAMVGTLVFTAASWLWSDVYRRPLSRTFLTSQSLLDVVLVTTIVHVTGGQDTQFAALYILVFAIAALLLPTRGALLISLLGCALYFGDALLGHTVVVSPAVLLQLAVFAVVALGSALISVRLQEAGAGTAELAAELTLVRLQADDILRNIRAGVLTVDEAGNLLYVNPAAGALVGLPLGDQLGRPVLGAIGERSPALAQALGRAANAPERVARAEATIRRPGTGDMAAGEFPIGVTTTRVVVTGERPATTVTAIFSDISDQKRLEQLHLRAERLEAIAELGASLAHEIRNPLAAIRSAVEQLARMPGADPDSATLSGLIVRQSDRLSRLLSEFLDFARVRVTAQAPVDLGAVARDAAGLVAAHPDRREGVIVDCHVPDAPVVIMGDDDLLHRVVFNLALNALQAAHARVRLEVDAAAGDQLPAGVLHEHGTVALRVTDDGPGIAPEIRERLFDPFFTTKPGGSGLGLAIVHRAIEAHRGLVLTDRIGGRTRFTVLLPRAPHGEPA